MNIYKTESKVKKYYVIMAVSIEDTSYYHKVFGRKYYMVQFENNIEKIYLTSNEPTDSDDNFELDEDFILIFDFNHMLEDFEKSELIGLILNSNFNSPPKYIYYDIITINDEIKPFVLNHLKNSIEGFSDLDLSQKEKEQIDKWVKYLSS